ncbi:MAG TPA: GNAT family N-acetyltransferase, partial [Actinomycetota bacterium]|nr:GNAT family N-acetyltransferase [Actinomycetota bacterium]
MPADAAAAASALARNSVHLCSALPGAWARRVGGLLSGVVGVPIPTLNGVWTEEASVDVALVNSLLDEVAASGLPHCLQIRPALSQSLGRLAARRGMSLEEQIPLMVLDDPARLSAVPAPPGCRLRMLSPDEAPIHTAVAAAGFEAPVELFQEMMQPSVLAARGVRTYLAEIDGEAVATGIGCTLDGWVGIFNIATIPAYRRRGAGAAITRQAVADGLAA